MKEKFIKKDDLGEIMAELAEKVYKHKDTLSLNIDLSTHCSKTKLKIAIYMTVECVYSATYMVIDTLKDGFDVVDDAMGSALCELEKAQEKKNEESKENK